jgi:hypothetical protein
MFITYFAIKVTCLRDKNYTILTLRNILGQMHIVLKKLITGQQLTEPFFSAVPVTVIDVIGTLKAVPLHATEALGEKGVYLLLILDLGTRWG